MGQIKKQSVQSALVRHAPVRSQALRASKACLEGEKSVRARFRGVALTVRQIHPSHWPQTSWPR